MIVLTSEEMTKALKKQLYTVFDTYVCCDGCEALEQMMILRPDFLVLDLMIPGIDGVSLLETMHDVHIMPKVVAIAPVFTPYVVGAAERFRISYLAHNRVAVSTLASRILDVARWEEDADDLSEYIRNTLASLGIDLSGSGYRFMEKAVELYMAEPGQSVVRQLYPAVANACSGTATQVEKSIRWQISGASTRCNQYVWRAYFPSSDAKKIRKPSNLEFIKMIAQCVKEKTSSPKDKDERTCIAL